MTTALVTGGTGSFGSAFLRLAPKEWTIRVYSRDELKQSELAEQHPSVRFLIGDVRDYERLAYACQGVNLIVHAAALKQVPSCEYNPFECVKTNVLGSENVVRAAIANAVPRSILLSSDKAVDPINVYGASKLLAERLFLAANAWAGRHACKFSVVRYGNVIGSRGSLHEKLARGTATLAHPEATRFWMPVEDAVKLVLTAHTTMRGGEVYLPKLRSQRVAEQWGETATGFVPPKGEYTGLAYGEKVHESLLSAHDVERTFDCGTHYEIVPSGHSWTGKKDYVHSIRPVGEGFCYASDEETILLGG